MAKFILAALFASTLAACGGGSDAPPPPVTPPASVPVPAPAPAPACIPKQVTVAILGDSTNYAIDGTVDLTTIKWWDPRAQAKHSPPIELQALMDAQFGPGNVVVTDYAVPGSYAEIAPQGIVADVIVENFEINDKNGGFPLSVYAADILKLHPTIVETGIPAALGDPREDGYNDTVRGLGLPVADVDRYVKSLPNWQSYYPNTASAHVTDELYKMITDNVLAPVVVKQVAPLRCVNV